ncbi:MAG: undecaprenyldiphospho-muramoylpentapeptide beta-N-acetylglucosaminyltransferase [Flavobacteriaceae bacterium]|nr:undecaprenyldiphospho-muramoylpentapeptide beta-N-acetylglucosaminyltransferase [Flavobacteriaceae bacterium]
MRNTVNILLSGGGTGGHIYPAIAIANELKNRNQSANILFVGANNRMEMEKVPQAGYEIKGLWISGIQRKLTIDNLMFPFKLISSCWNAFKIIRQFKPSVVIGTGGFASGPTLLVANWLKIPTLIQEQNSYPGITNKLLAKKTAKICVAYDGMEKYFPADKLIKTGNPVRNDLLQVTNVRDEAISFFNLNLQKRTLLVLGGSLGARAINQLIEKNIDYLVSKNIQVIWQTGKLYYEDYKSYDAVDGIQTHTFLNQMNFAYAAADFIISRAGASSISELCIVAKPTIFIPSPNVAEDHQTKNAQAVVNNNAALMIRESALTSFKNVFDDLLNDEKKQIELGLNMNKMALPEATFTIVDEIEKLITINK